MFDESRFVRSVLVVFVLALCHAGCSEDDGPSDSANNATTVDASTAADTGADAESPVDAASDTNDDADSSTRDTSGDTSVDADSADASDASPDTSPGTSEWAKQIGGSSADGAGDVVIDAQGNIIICGRFSDTVDFGGGALDSAGAKDIFLAKYDASGDHLWSERLGAGADDAATALAVDAQGNILVVGHFRDTVDFGGGALTSAGFSDIFVAKYDSSGAHLWSERFGAAASDGAHAVALDSQGRVLVTGFFDETVDFGGGPLASSPNGGGFVLALDSGGAHVWSEAFGGDGYDYGNEIAVDSQDNVIFAGVFSQTVSFGGDDLTSDGSMDAFIAKWDADANHQWSHGFGSFGEDATDGLAVDSQDNVVAAGYFTGEADLGGGYLFTEGLTDEDIFLVKYDNAGAHLWSDNFNGGRFDKAHDVAVNSQDDIVVTGYFQGAADFGGGTFTSAGRMDAFVARFDSGGSHLDSAHFSGAEQVIGTAVAMSAQDAPTVLGTFVGTAEFAGQSWTATGNGSDVFLVGLPAP